MQPLERSESNPYRRNWKEGINEKGTEEIWKCIAEKFNQVIDDVPIIKPKRKKKRSHFPRILEIK